MKPKYETKCSVCNVNFAVLTPINYDLKHRKSILFNEIKNYLSGAFPSFIETAIDIKIIKREYIINIICERLNFSKIYKMPVGNRICILCCMNKGSFIAKDFQKIIWLLNAVRKNSKKVIS